MLKKSVLLLSLFCTTTAYAAEICGVGQYMNGDTCAPCPPTDETTARTTFPDEYYPYDSATGTYVKTTEPTLVDFEYESWVTGLPNINMCVVVYYYSNAAGLFGVESVFYNPATGKYDATDGYVRYNVVNPTYYLDTRFRDDYCTELPIAPQFYKKAIACPVGYYCPGLRVPSCATDAYKSERGRIECPAGHYCPAGAAAPTPCPVGTYSDTTGASDDSVCKPCTNAPQNASYTGSATTNSCPWECDDGYGLHDGACAQLCTGGMRYVKTSNGLQFNLYPVVYSTPALHVKRNDAVCHAVLVPGAAANAININHNGQIYHMVD